MKRTKKPQSPAAQIKRLRGALKNVRIFVDNMNEGCICDGWEKDEMLQDPSAHAQYCPVYIDAYIAAALDGKPTPP